MNNHRSLETGKLKLMTPLSTQLLASCNLTGNRVMSDQWQQLTMLGDEAIWWQCPDCGGWHVLVVRKMSDEM